MRRNSIRKIYFSYLCQDWKHIPRGLRKVFRPRLDVHFPKDWKYLPPRVRTLFRQEWMYGLCLISEVQYSAKIRNWCHKVEELNRWGLDENSARTVKVDIHLQYLRLSKPLGKIGSCTYVRILTTRTKCMYFILKKSITRDQTGANSWIKRKVLFWKCEQDHV